MNITDDTIGPPDFMRSLLNLPEKDFADALGYDYEVFSWVTSRIEKLFLSATDLGKPAVFGTLHGATLTFLVFSAGPECKPQVRSFEAVDPSYFDSALGLQVVSEMAYHKTCQVVEEAGGIVDLVFAQFMMGFISFEEAKRFSFEKSVRHMPA